MVCLAVPLSLLNFFGGGVVPSPSSQRQISILRAPVLHLKATYCLAYIGVVPSKCGTLDHLMQVRLQDVRPGRSMIKAGMRHGGS